MKNYILGLILLTLGSCTNNNTEKATDTNTDSVSLNAKVPAPVNIELSNPVEQQIYNHYILLKNALVAKKVGDAAKAASELSTSLKARKGCENTGLIADKIAASKDIKAQRKEFVSLSSDVIGLFKHAALKKGEIYVQHCPMANDGNGADWLASESKIQNPYYGDEMMECGAVVEEIKATK
jgi:hypothetical protein